MPNRLPLAGDATSRLPSRRLCGSKLLKKRVATAAPALRLLQRRQLLRLAEQAAGAALLGALSLVVGHDFKLSAGWAAPQTRPRVVRIATFNPAEVHLVGQLSNPSVALAAVFEVAAVVRPEPRGLRESVVLEPASGRLGNGVVQRAVVKVLAMAQRPMCGQEVRLGVEALLGHPVSENSISSCLAYGVRRREPLFVRVTRARYVLA